MICEWTRVLVASGMRNLQTQLVQCRWKKAALVADTRRGLRERVRSKMPSKFIAEADVEMLSLPIWMVGMEDDG